jgi:hypothetical protein
MTTSVLTLDATAGLRCPPAASWTPPVYPLKKVVRRQNWTNKYCRPGEGRRTHYLECGHEIMTKQSDGYPRRKRCEECHRQASNEKDKP